MNIKNNKTRILNILSSLAINIRNVITDLEIYRYISRTLEDLLKKVDVSESPRKVLIPIFYWGGTNVSWLSIVIALRLAARGSNVFFILDYQILNIKQYSVKMLLIKNILKKICRISRLNMITAPEATDFKAEFDEMIIKKNYFNMQWREKKSISFEEFKKLNYEDKNDRYIVKKIDNVLRDSNFDLCICPGGIYKNSFFWRMLCKNHNVKFLSFDAAGARLCFGPGVAGHRLDIVTRVNSASDISEAEIERQVRQDVYKRSRLTLNKFENMDDRITQSQFDVIKIDQFFTAFQDQVHHINALGNIVIFLNSSWDSAALDIEPWQITQHDWLKKLINELLACGANNITIRQHPDELFYPSNDDYSSLLNGFLSTYPNAEIKLITPSEQANSYDLIKNGTSIFTFTSTIGLEACILGRPTFVFKKNYQVELDALINYVPGKLTENINMFFDTQVLLKKNAMLAYFFGQIIGWHKISIEDLYLQMKSSELICNIDSLLDENYLQQIER